MTGKILPKSFYLRENVVEIARELLGKVLSSKIDGKLTSGIICETEAYAGISDKASHAYNNRRTARTEVMYMEGGIAYIYLCYGIHSLFNVVTNKTDIPHAVLIRGIFPLEGKELMMKRANKKRIDKHFGIGPGKVSKILGLHYSMSGKVFLYQKSNSGTNIRIEDWEIKIPEKQIEVGKRVGVGYAAEDADLPYRFQIKNPEGLFRGFLINSHF